VKNTETVSWIFAAGALIYLAGMAIWLSINPQKDLPDIVNRILGFLCAIAAGFCTYFFTGELGLTFKVPETDISGNAAGGFGAFVLVLLLLARHRRPKPLTTVTVHVPPQPNALHDIVVRLHDEYRRPASFNVNLRDLLLAETGIVKMLDDLREAPSKDRLGLWRAVKSRAKTTHDRFENLYGAISVLGEIGVFGEKPSILNKVDRIIAAKQHTLYRLVDSLPEDEVPDDDTLTILSRKAHKLQPISKDVEDVQREIGDYLNEKRDYIVRLLKDKKASTNHRAELVE
jgi:hypothetical protein